jgi:hypothetical protein
MAAVTDGAGEIVRGKISLFNINYLNSRDESGMGHAL